MLRQTLEGPWLRDWAERAVPAFQQTARSKPGIMSGTILVERAGGASKTLPVQHQRGATGSRWVVLLLGSLLWVGLGLVFWWIRSSPGEPPSVVQRASPVPLADVLPVALEPRVPSPALESVDDVVGAVPDPRPSVSASPSLAEAPVPTRGVVVQEATRRRFSW